MILFLYQIIITEMFRLIDIITKSLAVQNTDSAVQVIVK